ncbi:hypothetical protein [Arachnia propionica]|uniref:Photosystem I assembly protein Ycf4 n=1 Tax=Arachnia propionica TaxID=1750 RepID=A0A3P1WYP3_9ACTN|nr:hypothetical protein [Arachnia propionica]RRD50797.1 hypothetical protein EII35_03455 [Arachnia propionica]
MTRTTRFRRGRHDPVPLSADALNLRYVDSPSSMVAVLTLAGFTVLLSCGGVWGLARTGGGHVAAWLALAAGLTLAALTAWLGSLRMTVNATGFHLCALSRRKDIPWPTSRRGLASRQIPLRAGLVQTHCLVRHDKGPVCMIPGLMRGGFDRAALRQKAEADLDRIWDWGLRKGYVRAPW